VALCNDGNVGLVLFRLSVYLFVCRQRVLMVAGAYYVGHSGHTDLSNNACKSKMYTLGLQPYTWYDVYVQPFRGNVDGASSTIVRQRTSEDGSLPQSLC